MGARVRRRDVVRMDDCLELRATEEVRPDEAHKLVHGCPLGHGASTSSIRNLEAGLRASQLLAIYFECL